MCVGMSKMWGVLFLGADNNSSTNVAELRIESLRELQEVRKLSCVVCRNSLCKWLALLTNRIFQECINSQGNGRWFVLSSVFPHKIWLTRFRVLARPCPVHTGSSVLSAVNSADPRTRWLSCWKPRDMVDNILSDTVYITYTDNSTANKIANNTCKQQRSRAMDIMRFHWLQDKGAKANLWGYGLWVMGLPIVMLWAPLGSTGRWGNNTTN